MYQVESISALYRVSCELFFGRSEPAFVESVRSKTKSPLEVPFLFFEGLDDSGATEWPRTGFEVHPEHVAAAYSLLLHRFPEAWDVVDYHCANASDTTALVLGILSSPEFKATILRVVTTVFPDAARVWHLHIPRTGGSAFRDAGISEGWGVVSLNHLADMGAGPKNIAEQLSLRKLSKGTVLFSGHAELSDWADYIRPLDTVLAFLRNPVERILSHFNYINGKFETDPSFEHHETRFFKERGFEPNDLLKSLESPLFADNIQCRLLGRQGTSANALQTAMTTGCQLLLEKDVSPFSMATFGSEPELGCNASASYLSMETVPEEILSIIRVRNLEDIKLYRVVKNSRNVKSIIWRSALGKGDTSLLDKAV